MLFRKLSIFFQLEICISSNLMEMEILKFVLFIGYVAMMLFQLLIIGIFLINHRLKKTCNLITLSTS